VYRGDDHQTASVRLSQPTIVVDDVPDSLPNLSRANVTDSTFTAVACGDQECMTLTDPSQHQRLHQVFHFGIVRLVTAIPCPSEFDGVNLQSPVGHLRMNPDQWSGLIHLQAAFFGAEPVDTRPLAGDGTLLFLNGNVMKLRDAIEIRQLDAICPARPTRCRGFHEKRNVDQRPPA